MNSLDVINIRKNLKLTQEEFGKLIGVDKRTVINYEQGKMIPKTKASLLELMLSNGIGISGKTNNDKKEAVLLENNKILLEDIEVLKDHIRTLKDLIVEKTKTSEMYMTENELLREKITRLELKIFR